MSERKCHACGADLSQMSGAAFCPFCGAKCEDAAPITAPPSGVFGILRRAEMALEEGAFDRAHALCETALNTDPECATAYFYQLLASLRVRDRAALGSVPALFDQNEYYKKAFRFGDAALRKELLDALYAIDAREKEKVRAKEYENAVSVLAAAKDIPACRRAKTLFLALGDYRDAAAMAERCDAEAARLHETWEGLKAQKREAAVAKKKENKRLLLITLGVLALLLVLAVVLTLVFRVFIPNGMRKDALALMAAGDCDTALDLLAEAREKALFESTQEKIDEAEATVNAEIDRLTAERERAEEIADAVKRAESFFADGEFLKGIRAMMGVDVRVCLHYDAPDAELWIGNQKTESTVWYENAVSFYDIATAKRPAYVFEEWETVSCGYDAATGVYSATLRAEFSAYEYKLNYALVGGKADNPDGYGVTTPTFTLTPPVRYGYTFIGWTGTGLSSVTPEVTIKTGSKGNRYYTAHWKAASSRVTLDAAGGDVTENEVTATFGEYFSLPTPTREGYRFLGWYLGNQRVEASVWERDEDVTLRAKWEPISYRITYVLGMVPATNRNPASYTVEMNDIVLKDPTHPYCTFLGWYTNASYTTRVTTIPTDTMGTVVLVAKWDIPTFTVTLDLNGGTGLATTATYSALDLPLSLSSLKPEKEYHSFYYWAQGEMDGVPVDSLDACEDVTLVANYLPEGTELLIIHGGGFQGERCEARYWPSAHNATLQKDLVFPKYHRVSYFKGSPYIQMIDIVNRIGVESISYSDQVLDVSAGSGITQTVRK